MELKNYFAQDAAGNALAGATVHVYEPGTTTHVSGLEDAAGAPLANPFLADADAKIQFAAPDGLYDLRVISGPRDYTIRVQANDQTELVAPGGSSKIGFLQEGAGAVSRTAEAKLRELVSVLDFGAVGTASGDQSQEINNALASLVDFPANGTGGEVKLNPGRYRISSPITLAFGQQLIGAGSDIYQSVIELNDDFVGEAAIIFNDPGVSYLNGHLKNIAVNCRNIAGVNGVSFYGAYRNSSIQDFVAYNVAGDASGIKVAPMTHGGALGVCESVLLKDIYVLKASGVTSTKPGILIEKCQETTLLNVKSFNGQNPGPVLGDSCLHIKDSRGIVVINGGFVGGDNGIFIEAATRRVDSITLLNPTFENNGTNELKVLGTASFSVDTVDMPTFRRESPFATNVLDAQFCSFLTVNIQHGNATLGANVNNTVLHSNGAGTVTANAAAQYNLLAHGNATRAGFRVTPSFNIHSANSPSNLWTVEGRASSYSMYWSATSSVDNGFRIQIPSGSRAIEIGDTGSAARLGFFGAAHTTKPTITGSRGGNAALADLLTKLATLGLITDSTSA